MDFRSLLVLALLLIVGCAQSPDSLSIPDRVTVQLLTSGGGSGRWERASESGLDRIAAELDADVRQIRYREGFRPLADIGAGLKPPDIVFCVGLGFEATLLAVAPEYAQTMFILLQANVQTENVTSLVFRTDGVGYLAGVLTAALSGTSTVGIIRGPGGEWLGSLESGFTEGFSSNRRDSKVVIAEGSDAPWDVVQQHAEIALYACELVDVAVLAAAHDAGLRIIAVDSELLVAEPDVVVAAVHINVPEAMLRTVKALMHGDKPEAPVSFGLASGVVDLELGSALDELMDPAIREALDAARAEVISGVFEIERFGM